jgi:hypothetical protein
MGNLNEKEKRDFVSQTILTVEENATMLTDAGFDPTNRVTQMKTELATADQAEISQQQVQAAALDATRVAQQTLKVAYDDASAMINLIEGLLGKDNSLVHKLRQLRK